jgi:hypothetical protein
MALVRFPGEISRQIPVSSTRSERRPLSNVLCLKNQQPSIGFWESGRIFLDYLTVRTHHVRQLGVCDETSHLLFIVTSEDPPSKLYTLYGSPNLRGRIAKEAGRVEWRDGAAVT